MWNRLSQTSKFISSDPYAASGNTELRLETLYFPENDVLCELKKTALEISFFDLNLQETNLYKTEANFNVGEDSDKGEFEHYMLKEIHEQPKLIRESIIHYFDNNPNAETIKNLKPSQVSLTACGTAYYATLVIRDYLENFAKTQSRCDVASELRYRSTFFQDND